MSSNKSTGYHKRQTPLYRSSSVSSIISWILHGCFETSAPFLKSSRWSVGCSWHRTQLHHAASPSRGCPPAGSRRQRLTDLAQCSQDRRTVLSSSSPRAEGACL